MAVSPSSRLWLLKHGWLWWEKTEKWRNQKRKWLELPLPLVPTLQNRLDIFQFLGLMAPHLTWSSLGHSEMFTGRTVSPLKHVRTPQSEQECSRMDWILLLVQKKITKKIHIDGSLWTSCAATASSRGGAGPGSLLDYRRAHTAHVSWPG